MNCNIELVKVRRGDAKQVFESWGHNRSNFRYLSATPQRSVADSEAYLDGLLANPNDLAFHISLCDSGAIAGIIKAKREQHKAQVGYVVDEAFRSRGIATEALNKMVVVLCREPDIHRIWAMCAVDNTASSAVLEKCGFVREGILRRWIVYPEQGPEPHDNYRYFLPCDA